MDPGAYRPYLIFQLAQEYYKTPLLYDKFMGQLVFPGPNHNVDALGKLYDFQLTYEHNARAQAKKNPDFRYVDLPAEINLSDPSRNDYYSKNAVVVLPGLETPGSVQSIPVRAVSSVGRVRPDARPEPESKEIPVSRRVDAHHNHNRKEQLLQVEGPKPRVQTWKQSADRY